MTHTPQVPGACTPNASAVAVRPPARRATHPPRRGQHDVRKRIRQLPRATPRPTSQRRSSTPGVGSYAARAVPTAKQRQRPATESDLAIQVNSAPRNPATRGRCPQARPSRRRQSGLSVDSRGQATAQAAAGADRRTAAPGLKAAARYAQLGSSPCCRQSPRAALAAPIRGGLHLRRRWATPRNGPHSLNSDLGRVDPLTRPLGCAGVSAVRANRFAASGCAPFQPVLCPSTGSCIRELASLAKDRDEEDCLRPRRGRILRWC